MRAKLLYTISLSALLLSMGCQPREHELPAPKTDAGQRDMGAIDQDPARDLATPAPSAPLAWRVHVSPSAPSGVRWAAQDAVDYLSRMGRDVSLVESAEDAGACAPKMGRLIFVGDGLGATNFRLDEVTDQSFAYHEERCDSGVVVELWGGGLLGRQYAAYEWLHAVGVRFFHPEQEFVPAAPRWREDPLHREHTPDFTWRSTSLHLTHPLELGDVFRLDKEEFYPEGRRYIAWQIKNGASYGHQGYGSKEGKDYGVVRGLPRATGFNLHNQQQGFQPIVDPDDPRSDEEQIADAIDERMGNDPTNYPEFFGFTFNPSEFTELDDRVVVRQLTFIADHFAQNYPDTILTAINHGTAGEPTEHYGVRYYDLPKFAPPNLGVRVHTLMFYDLFRPAPVYGNEDFNYLYDFMVEEHQTRRIWHYPESAWWLTFDNNVPLYLPITIEARDRDIQGIKWMLDGKLDGHRVFGSGHEWGYWQNEYCSYRMAMDVSYRYTDCVRDIAWATGAGSEVVEHVLLDTIAMQERDIVYGGELLRYLVGTDPETEVAASIGIHFHALPPVPREIMGWDASQLDSWDARIAPSLERMHADYARHVASMRAVRDEVLPSGLPWFDEILDGLEINGLRALHARQVYGAVVTLRRSQLEGDSALAEEASALLEQAKATTEAAREVVARREQGYRYMPIERSIGGGEDGTEDENWTVYGYRVHNRTHHVYYYKRIDDMVTEVFEGGGEAVKIEDAILAPDESLVVESLDPSFAIESIDYGDGTTTQTLDGPHDYTTPGIYTVRVTGTLAGQPYTYEARVAAVDREQSFGFTGDVISPEGVELIEPVLPGLVVGEIFASGEVAVGFSASESGAVKPSLWGEAGVQIVQAELRTSPREYSVPIVTRSTEEIVASIRVEDGVINQDVIGGAATLTGALATEAVVQAIVAVGGFEERGARRLVASTLGYTVDTLPETVPFELVFDAPDAGE